MKEKWNLFLGVDVGVNTDITSRPFIIPGDGQLI